ncbi:unnamed protein product [Schistosoma mattheei]|uniref:Uncharacterized protein n=1 Tax=Schistosoma mattheei TaxID=31246 RepID=A0A183PX61_9TREM|nr:unnamed protein product [Schistosoma mattheei]
MIHISEENTLNESNHDRKSDAVLIDADFFNDPLSSNDISNKFEENISKESNPDAKPRIPDNFIPNSFYPHHEVSSNEYSSQRANYVINLATSFITRGNEDPTLFLHGGHIKPQDLDEFIPTLVVNSNSSEQSLDHTESVFSTQSDKSNQEEVFMLVDFSFSAARYHRLSSASLGGFSDESDEKADYYFSVCGFKTEENSSVSLNQSIIAVSEASVVELGSFTNFTISNKGTVKTLKLIDR